MLSIDEYYRQRQARKQVRDSYLTSLQEVTKKYSIYQASETHNKQKHIKSAIDPPKHEIKEEQDIELIERENEQLKIKLNQLQNQRGEFISGFKQKIETIKNLYTKKITQITDQGKKFREEYTKRITKISEQIITGESKCKQIEQTNKQIEEQMSKNGQVTAAYMHQIEEEYEQKLKEFQKVMNMSTKKIMELEEQSNVQQIVQAALANNQLIEQIKQNAESAQKQIDRLFTDYNELLVTKQEIIKQLTENNCTKERQIGSFRVFEDKLNQITQKLQKKKEIYNNQNQHMSKQLLQIRDLLMKVMGKQI